MVEQGCALRGELGWSSAIPCPPQVYMYQLFRSLATSTPRACVTDIKPQNTLVDPDTAVPPSSAILAGEPHLGWAWVAGKGRGRDPDPWPVLTPAHIYHSAKQLVRGEPNVSYICSRYYRTPELILGRLHLIHRSDLAGGGGNSHGSFEVLLCVCQAR